MTPYTYLVGWSEHSIYYYGVRYANGCSPEDLWEEYFTSSKVVSEKRSALGEPDVVQIRKRFKTKSQAQKWEETVLRRMKVVGREDFLNRSLVGAYDWSGRKRNPFTDEHKEKLAEANRGKKQSQDSKDKISKALKGKPKSAEHNKKVSEAMKGKASRKGHKNTEEHKRKISAAIKMHWEKKRHVSG